MPTQNELEKFLQKMILPDLKRGRPNDVAHTLLVVYYLKEIIAHSPELSVDLSVLLIAAYAHDWGYADLFANQNPLSLSAIATQKDTHMSIGSSKLATLLINDFFAFLTSHQKERAVHLVLVHDALEKLKDSDELLLMEADTLGGLDHSVMGLFPDSESEDRFMRKSKKLRLAKFITTYGKLEYERLFAERIKYVRV